MRIVHESPDLLIVTERATGMRVVGSLLGACGVVLAANGVRISSIPAEIVGTCIAAIGSMFALLPSFSTFYFNRAEKRFLVARRRVWSRGNGGYDEYPQRAVLAVIAEETTSDDRSTSPNAVRLADGRSIPFTSYYTSGYGAKAAMAERIAAFLGVETNAKPTSGARSPHAIVRGSRRAAVGIAFAFVAFGVLFGSIGGVNLAREYRRLTTWQPIQATVLSKRVDVRTDSDGSTYRPEVVYRYSVDDQSYTSSRTLPINESRSGRWAYRVIEPFVVGGRYTAWYNPGNPAEAFIVRSHSIIAPVFTAIGLIVALGGCAAVVSVLRNPN
jgi:hypothetical protein